MHYKQLLTLSASVILLAGCTALQTQLQPEAVKKTEVRHVASDRPVVSKPSPSADVKATYPSTTDGGTMTETSVSAPIQREESVAPAVVPPPATGATVPSVPRANKAVSAQSDVSLATGFSVDMPYDDAWPKVRKALPAAGYSVMEKDDLTGTYYVLDKIGSGGKIERDTPIYQVRLTKAGDASTKIILLDSASQPASSSASNRILGALKNKLD
jgi:uncharacterized lipoprotein